MRHMPLIAPTHEAQHTHVHVTETRSGQRADRGSVLQRPVLLQDECTEQWEERNPGFLLTG